MRTPRNLDEDKPSAQIHRFKVKPKACGFRSGVDVLRLNQLNDELEVEDLQPGLRWTNPLR
jgi:hypothetical protein